MDESALTYGGAWSSDTDDELQEFNVYGKVEEYDANEGEFSIYGGVPGYDENGGEYNIYGGVPGYDENGGETPKEESFTSFQNIQGLIDNFDSMRLEEMCDAVGGPVLTDDEYTITSIDHLEEIDETLMGVPMIQSIKIGDPGQRDIEAVLEIVMKHCRDIRQLDIGYGLNVHADRLLQITEKFPNLDSLFTPLWFETEEVVKKVGKLSHLRQLEIYRATPHVSPKLDLKPIAGGCPNLVHLDIGCCEYTEVDFVYLVQQKKQQLKTLRFTSICFEAGTVVPLSECTFLEEVACDYFSSETLPLVDFVHEIAALPHLKTVGLGLCEDIGENDLERLSSISFASRVTALDLKYTHFSEDFPRIIASCFPNIRELCIENCSECDSRVLQDLLRFNELQRLELVRWPFSQEWCMAIPRWQQLQDLALYKCYRLDDENIIRLLALLNLCCLTITECFTLSNEFLESFPRTCDNLKKLHVEVDEVSKKCVDDLKSRLRLTVVEVGKL